MIRQLYISSVFFILVHGKPANYDQRQAGDLNFHAKLDNVMIVIATKDKEPDNLFGEIASHFLELRSASRNKNISIEDKETANQTEQATLSVKILRIENEDGLEAKRVHGQGVEDSKQSEGPQIKSKLQILRIPLVKEMENVRVTEAKKPGTINFPHLEDSIKQESSLIGNSAVLGESEKSKIIQEKSKIENSKEQNPLRAESFEELKATSLKLETSQEPKAALSKLKSSEDFDAALLKSESLGESKDTSSNAESLENVNVLLSNKSESSENLQSKKFSVNKSEQKEEKEADEGKLREKSLSGKRVTGDQQRIEALNSQKNPSGGRIAVALEREFHPHSRKLENDGVKEKELEVQVEKKEKDVSKSVENKEKRIGVKVEAKVISNRRTRKELRMLMDDLKDRFNTKKELPRIEGSEEDNFANKNEVHQFAEQQLKPIGDMIENCGPGRIRNRYGICQFDDSFN